MKVNVVDLTFAHDCGTCAGRSVYPFEWNRCFPEASNRIYTDTEIYRVVETRSNINAALTLESRGIQPEIYELVKQHSSKFKILFTHDYELLDRYPEKSVFKPGAGIGFLGDSVYSEQTGSLHMAKSSLCSFLLSDKQYCVMHSARIGFALSVNKLFRHKVDIILPRVKTLRSRLKHLVSPPKPWNVPCQLVNTLPGKSRKEAYSAALNKYRFTISVENYIDKYFFTEKLLSPFATKCVPIYFGATNAHEFFDPRGYFRFSSLDQLLEVVDCISEKTYEDMLPYINRNYEKARDFMSIEHYLHANSLEQLSLYAE